MKALIFIAILLASSQSLASTTWETESLKPYEIQTILSKLVDRFLANSQEAEVTLNQRLKISNSSGLLVVVRQITRGFNASGYYEQVNQYICNRLKYTAVGRSVRKSACTEASYEMRFQRNIKKALL